MDTSVYSIVLLWYIAPIHQYPSITGNHNNNPRRFDGISSMYYYINGLVSEEFECFL